MNRTGLLVALSLTVATSVAFGFFPSFDLALSQTFYNGPIQDTSGRMLAWYCACAPSIFDSICEDAMTHFTAQYSKSEWHRVGWVLAKTDLRISDLNALIARGEFPPPSIISGVPHYRT